MSLYTFEKPEVPWCPDKNNDMEDFWQLKNSTNVYIQELLNIKGSIIEKRYKRIVRESRFPESCSPYSDIDTAYKLFFIGVDKDFTRKNGSVDFCTLQFFDENYRDGGEDEEGGCIWIERHKRWFTPRKVQIFF